MKKAFPDPVDTGRKLNIHKTFIGRPGHLLNVLCTFNTSCVYWGDNFFSCVFDKKFIEVP